MARYGGPTEGIASVRKKRSAPERFVHDTKASFAACVLDGKDGLLFFQDPVSHEQTQEITLFEGKASLLGDISAMIVEDHGIARQEVTDPAPIAPDEVASLSDDSANEMIQGEAKAVALDGVELYDRLRAGFKETSVP